jgi:hypothetical protein
MRVLCGCPTQQLVQHLTTETPALVGCAQQVHAPDCMAGCEGDASGPLAFHPVGGDGPDARGNDRGSDDQHRYLGSPHLPHADELQQSSQNGHQTRDRNHGDEEGNAENSNQGPNPARSASKAEEAMRRSPVDDGPQQHRTARNDEGLPIHGSIGQLHAEGAELARDPLQTCVTPRRQGGREDQEVGDEAAQGGWSRDHVHTSTSDGIPRTLMPGRCRERFDD